MRQSFVHRLYWLSVRMCVCAQTQMIQPQVNLVHRQGVPISLKRNLKWTPLYALALQKFSIRRMLILVFIMALAAWCWYNVGIIMTRYFSFNTMVSLYKEPPNITEFPGITVCAPTIFTPEHLAGKVPVS